MWREKAKIFAFIFLFFASSTALSAQSSIYRLEPGTKIRLQMETEINSEVSGVDDTFTAKIAEPLRVRETIVLPAGLVVEGRVTRAAPAARAGRGGVLTVRFEKIRFENGDTRRIEAVLVDELKAESVRKANVWTVLGGTAIGALIGAATGKGSGALIGAGLGAGIGTGAAVARKGRDVRIRSNEKFDIELVREVTLPVLEY